MSKCVLESLKNEVFIHFPCHLNFRFVFCSFFCFYYVSIHISTYLLQGRRQHGCSGCICTRQFPATGALHPSWWRIALQVALFQSENELFESKMELLDAKMWYNFEFLECGINPLPLKNFMHPSCQVLGAAPAMFRSSGQWHDSIF